MAAHGLLDLSLGRRPREVELLVKGVKLEDIAVASDRRMRTAVAGALPVVQAFAGSGRETSANTNRAYTADWRAYANWPPAARRGLLRR